VILNLLQLKREKFNKQQQLFSVVSCHMWNTGNQ
jgi:hypothetical protein